jgi:hypothetical protein
VRDRGLAWWTAVLAFLNVAGALVAVPVVRDQGLTAQATEGVSFASGAGSRLLVASCSGLVEVDVDARSIQPLALPEAPDCQQHRTLVRRKDAVVVLGQETAFAVPVDPSKPTLALAKARSVFPSLAADRVWLVTQTRDADGSGVAPLARELRLDGRVTAGGVRMAFGRVPHAAVPGGFVTVGFRSGGEVAVVDGGGTVRRRLTDPGLLVDTTGEVVGWVEGRGQGRLLIGDAGAGGPPRRADLPPGIVAFGGAGAFSPNGVTLALAAVAADGSHHLALVDVATGSASVVPGTGPAPPLSSVAWSPDGQRVFSARSVAPEGSYRIDAFTLGQPGAEALPLPFLRGQGPASLAVL